MSAKVNNTTELAKLMHESEADPHHYSIYPDDNFFYDTVCYICHKKEGWEIGTFERGSSHHVRLFTNEAKACQAFLEDFYPEVLNGKK